MEPTMSSPPPRPPASLPGTMFESIRLRPLLRGVARWGLRINGWRVEGSLPAEAQRCVMIAAPHTSNWDLPYTLMAAFALELHARWMGKHTIFRWPFRTLMQWLGGIPVDRRQASNTVAASVDALRNADRSLQLIVPPEGTRSRTRQWKTGFWHIAMGADVPIVLAYMDYERKLVGLGPAFRPSGDIEADMREIRAFYAPFKGRNADQFEA
jgi:1-acyl-sn-glycerol-3-phosphate acyltransferase